MTKKEEKNVQKSALTTITVDRCYINAIMTL